MGCFTQIVMVLICLHASTVADRALSSLTGHNGLVGLLVLILAYISARRYVQANIDKTTKLLVTAIAAESGLLILEGLMR